MPDRYRVGPTEREIEVLRAVVRLGTMKAAAAYLHLSRHTVDTYLDRLRDKSGCRTLPQLSQWGEREGYLKSESRTEQR